MPHPLRAAHQERQARVGRAFLLAALDVVSYQGTPSQAAEKQDCVAAELAPLDRGGRTLLCAAFGVVSYQGTPSGVPKRLPIQLAFRRWISEVNLRRSLLLLAFALVAPSLCHAQDAEADLKVEVKLVNVFVTVTDERGAPVGSLNKEDFRLAEDGKEQKIAVFDRQSELPLSIITAIDTSLSTKKDLKLEVESARRFAHAILRPIDGMALYQFSEVVKEVVPFTSDVNKIDQGIARIRGGAATALYDAIYLGSEAMEQRHGRKVMVVITDGGDTASTNKYSDALRAAQQAEAIVYSIIVVPIEASAGRDTGGEHALIQIANDTGGKYFYATSLPQLDEAFRKISEELRTQYLLAYYPSKRYSDSDFRRVEIKLSAPASAAYHARYRSGYFTSQGHF